jgi:outer membrane protein insertion porin family
MSARTGARGRWLVAGAALLAHVLAAAAGAAPPTVTAVELISSHRLPEERVRGAIGDLAGKPLSRDAVRASLERLWALGLFAAIRVDERAEPDGVRLSYELAVRPLVRRIRWEGVAGLDAAELAGAAGLATGEEASEERLAQVRRDLLARYRREGFFAARVDLRVDPVADGNERDVTVVLDAGERARVGDVRVSGDTGLTPEEVSRGLALREGRPYRDRLVRDATGALEERLRREGFYEARVTAGAPDWHPETNRVDLDVRVAAGPRLRVEFDGRAAVPEAALRSRLTLSTSGVADAFEQEASARELEAVYRERGYAFARVEPEEARDGDRRVITFHVHEGPRVTVESVGFTGNRAVPSDRLAKMIETAPPGLLGRGFFRQDVVERDVRVVLAFLRAQGYPEAAVGPADVSFSEDRRRARVLIPVAEGPRLTVGAVNIEGERAVGSREIRAALPFKPGDPWIQARAEDGQRAIERLYAGRGHHAAIARLETSRRDATVDVSYRIEEGEPTRIGRILVRGLVLTRDDIVRRDLPFHPGDPLVPDRLLEGQRRLSELPAFAAVSVEPLRPPPAPFADVDVTVQERQPWHLDFGLGYGNKDGVRGFLELGHDNLFGTGSSASIRQRVSGGGQSIGFSERTDALGRVPWILGTPWWLDVDLFQEWSEQLGYDLGRYGLWAGIHRDLFPERIKGLRGDLWYRLESARYSNVDPTLAEADVTPGRELIASLTPILTLDRRDEPLDPKRGSLHRVSLETASAVLGSGISFLKARLETSWFLDWLSPTVLVVAGRVGLATTLADTPALPIQDRFFAGGATTVRGFREDRLGPLDARGNPTGGNGLAILNLEWRFPIWRWIGGTLFVDTGAVTPEVRDLRFDAFRTGAGGGIRITTPVGPVRVDVGYALQPIPGESRTQVYVTVGNPF